MPSQQFTFGGARVFGSAQAAGDPFLACTSRTRLPFRMRTDASSSRLLAD